MKMPFLNLILVEEKSRESEEIKRESGRENAMSTLEIKKKFPCILLS
jgi:hypothetical protein